MSRRHTLERAATDPRYIAQYQLACQRFDAPHEARPAPRPPPDGKLIAYFSAEYGLTECMPVYSGRPRRAFGRSHEIVERSRPPARRRGLLYQLGYFRQYLNADGWQQERYLENDFYSLPIQPAD